MFDITAGQLAAYPIVVGAIVAIVQFLKTYVSQVNGGITIIVAVVIGAIAGLFHVNGIDVTSGIFLGLAAVGVHTVASNVGTASTTTQS